MPVNGPVPGIPRCGAASAELAGASAVPAPGRPAARAPGSRHRRGRTGRGMGEGRCAPRRRSRRNSRAERHMDDAGEVAIGVETAAAEGEGGRAASPADEVPRSHRCRLRRSPAVRRKKSRSAMPEPDRSQGWLPAGRSRWHPEIQIDTTGRSGASIVRREVAGFRREHCGPSREVPGSGGPLRPSARLGGVEDLRGVLMHARPWCARSASVPSRSTSARFHQAGDAEDHGAGTSTAATRTIRCRRTAGDMDGGRSSPAAALSSARMIRFPPGTGPDYSTAR